MISVTHPPELVFLLWAVISRRQNAFLPQVIFINVMLNISPGNWLYRKKVLYLKTIRKQHGCGMSISSWNFLGSNALIPPLKNLSQSTRPTKVREKANDLNYLAELYRELTPVLSAMNLNYEGIRYYAGSVIKAKIFQLNQSSDVDRYVHVTAFIAHQYYRLQDNLVDVILSVVQSFQNSAQREPDPSS